MKQRFYFDDFSEDIYDSQIDDYPSNRTICGILNKQDQRIAELEELTAKKCVILCAEKCQKCENCIITII